MQEDQKVHQGQKKNEKTRKIQRILEEFKGITSMSRIKSGRKTTLIPKVKNDKAETVTSRKRIANVFGEFFSKLYAEDQPGEEVQDPHNSETRMNVERESSIDEVRNEIPEFTQDEVQAAIDCLKKKEKQVTTPGYGPKRRHQDLRRNDERNDQTDLQPSVETR